MELSDLAEGLEVVAEQRERGVAAVDDTDRDLAVRLDDYADELPCDGGSAAAVVETFTGGGDLESAADAGGVAPITAAKTLHLLGVDEISPLSADERAPCAPGWTAIAPEPRRRPPSASTNRRLRWPPSWRPPTRFRAPVTPSTAHCRRGATRQSRSATRWTGR